MMLFTYLSVGMVQDVVHEIQYDKFLVATAEALVGILPLANPLRDWQAFL
jgi:hypothetical protein